MSVIANFSLPAEQFELGHLLEVREGVQIRLESMIPTGETTIPYFWVKDPDTETVITALEDSVLVESVTVVDDINGETLLRVQWTDGIDGLIESITDTNGTVLDGKGHGDHWTFQLRFPEYDALSEFYRDIVDKGVAIELDGVYNPVETTEDAEFGLTPEQREALLIALDAGYFAVPRKTTMIELADELGISDSAASQRIRRGLSQILHRTIVERER